MTRQKISEYVQKWMDRHEPDTFVRNEHGKALYTAKYSTLNIQIFFEDLLADFIEDDEVVLPQANVSGSLPDFQDVIEARIEHFNSNFHTHEGCELQNALNTIRRLVPPIQFKIGG